MARQFLGSGRAGGADRGDAGTGSSRALGRELVEQRPLLGASRPAGVEQVGAALERAAQRLRPAPPGDPGVVARPQHLGHRPAPELGRAGCTAGTRAGRRRTTPRPPTSSLPITPGTQPGAPPRSPRARPPRRRRARSRRPRARRRRGGRRPAGRRPRSGRTAARTRRRAASSLRHRLVEAAPARPTSRQQRARRRRPPRPRRTAAPGVITIPAPPPNGVSSTLRCRSSVWSRGSWTRTSSRPRSRARPSSESAERALEVLGEDREDVDAHGASRRLTSSSPSGGSTTTTPASLLDDEHHRDQHAAVEHEQVVRRVRLDRDDATERRARRGRAPSAPISSCTHSSSSRASASGRR